MKSNVILIGLLVSCLSLRSQTVAQHLEDLKNGVLLVRLKDFERKAAYMEQLGIKPNRQQLKEARDQHNVPLVLGFRTYYNYSTVYFVSERDNEAIFNRQFKGHLFNDQLKSVDADIRSDQAVYICDYGPGNRPSDQSRYQLTGLSVRKIEQGKLLDIDSKLFFRGRKWRWSVEKTVKALNEQLTTQQKK